MSTTKPPRRNRPQPTSNARRTAPAYRRLDPAGYAQLDETEKRRHDLHLDIDAICDARPYAVLDRDSIGFPSAVSGSDSCGGGGADPGALNGVEAASQHWLVDAAVDWLAEWAEARAMVVRVANMGRARWGFDPDRGRDDHGRPGPALVEVCAWCSQPAPDGRDSDGKTLLRRVDQRPVHASPCYWTLAKQALRAGVSVGAHLAAHVSNGSNPKRAGA